MILCRYDWARTARLALYNGLFMGPLGHHYYQALDAVSHFERSRGLLSMEGCPPAP